MHGVLRFASAVIYTSDFPATLAFYRQVTGLELAHYDAELGFAVLGADQALAIASHAAGALMLADGYAAVRRERVEGVEVALWAADVAAAFAGAVAAGATPLTPPRQTPWGQTVAYVRAPEETALGFITPRGAGGRARAARDSRHAIAGDDYPAGGCARFLYSGKRAGRVAAGRGRGAGGGRAQVIFLVRPIAGSLPVRPLGPAGGELSCYLPANIEWRQVNYGQGEGPVEVDGCERGFYQDGTGALAVVLHVGRVTAADGVAFAGRVAVVVAAGTPFEVLLQGTEAEPAPDRLHFRLPGRRRYFSGPPARRSRSTFCSGRGDGMRRSERRMFAGLTAQAATMLTLVVLLVPANPINTENAARIQEGMTREVVEDMLCGPARDETTGPVALPDEAGWTEAAVVALIEAEAPVFQWRTDRAAVIVKVTDSGTVACRWCFAVQPAESIVARLRRWLHL